LSILIFLGYVWFVFPSNPGPGEGESVRLVVPWGGGARGAAKVAAEAGVIENQLVFALYLRLSGAARQLQAGSHDVQNDWTPERLARELTSTGMATDVSRLTIREGLSRYEIADLLEERELIEREDFLSAAARPC
jgi:cell division protein YceG involved in septum cleavage